MMAQCDTLLLVGTTFPYAEFLPKLGQARAVQIDVDPRSLSILYPTEVDLVGDSAETLRELIALLERKTDRAWRDEIEQNVTRWWWLVEAHALDDAAEGGELNPQRVFWELSEQLPYGCILTGDAGTATNWFARTIAYARE
jgi:pyruvate dehydrogenase (quinone)